MKWLEKTIGEITEIVTKGTTPTTYGFSFTEHGVNFIRAESISKDGRVNEETFLKISNECHIKLKRSQLKADDILFSIAGMALGKTGIVKESFLPANTNQAVGILRPIKEYVFPKFLQYQFINPNFNELVNRFSAQSAQPNINLTQLKSLKVYTPPLNTQGKIVSILNAYDELIENNLKRIALLEQAGQNIYEEWFVNMRFPGHDKIAVDKETRLPKGWVRTILGSFTEIRKGKNITSKSAIEGDVPVVAGGLKPAYYHNESNTETPVITVSASGANAGYVNIYLNRIWASDCSYIDSSMTEFVYFIYNLLKINQTLLFRLQRGSAQPHVYPKDLKEMEVIIPDPRIIKQFEDVVSHSYSQIRVLQKQIETLKKARYILLPRLMNQTIKV
jgi:type I restriction enzyme, S subunit